MTKFLLAAFCLLASVAVQAATPRTLALQAPPVRLVAPVIPPVAPTGTWRIPVSAGYDSNGTYTTVLANSSTNKTLTPMAVPASATTTYALSLGAVSAPGGAIYYVESTAGQATVVWSQSFDSTTGADGTWTVLPSTVMHPDSGDATGTIDNNRGQIVQIPAGAASWVRAVITVTSTTALQLSMGAFQWQNGAPNDFWIGVSMSIFHQQMLPLTVRANIQSLFPGQDPIWIDFGRDGANGAAITANDATALAAWPQASYFITDDGPNDFTYSQPNGKPYGCDSNYALISTDHANISALDRAAGRQPFFGAVTFQNTAVPVTPFADAVCNLQIGTTAYPDNGAEPYDRLQLINAIRASDSDYSVDRTLDAFMADGMSAFLDSADQIFISDGLHPASYGGTIYVSHWNPIWKTVYSGSPGPGWLQNAVTNEGFSTDLPRKLRLLDMFRRLPPTNSGAAQEARAKLLAQIDALHIGYVDPPGYTPLQTMTGVMAFFDSADIDTMVRPVNPQDRDNEVSSWTDRSASAFVLSQTGATTARPLFSRDAVRAAGGHGVMSFVPSYLASNLGGGSTVGAPAFTTPSTSSGLYHLLDAVAQPFSIDIGIRVTPPNPNTVKPFFTLAATGITSGALIMREGVNTNKVSVLVSTNGANTLVVITEATEPVVGSIAHLSLIYDGTTLTLRRDGNVVGTYAWAKPAWTGTAFTFGSLSQSDFLDFAIATQADTAAQQAAKVADWRLKWGTP